MSFLAFTVDGDFALLHQSSVSFLSHLDVKWLNLLIKVWTSWGWAVPSSAEAVYLGIRNWISQSIWWLIKNFLASWIVAEYTNFAIYHIQIQFEMIEI